MKKLAYLSLVGLLLLAACQQKTAQLPADYKQLDRPAVTFPDYADVVIPPNIAPLNFMVTDSALQQVVVHYQTEGAELVVGGGADGKVRIDTTQWRSLLQAARGHDIAVSIYACLADSGWVRYPDQRLSVAEEEIDSFLSYRLIEPGYELYRQLGLYQRNLTNFSQHPIYENNRKYDDSHNHCINCHNYRNYRTEDMLFHVRASHGGTIIIHGDEARKVQIKDSTIITAGVYPSWHPTQRLVAFSTNKTGQTFHIYHQEKVEVLDEASDLLLYDADRNEVTHILRSRDQLETFPCWSPDGRKLFYCNADLTHTVDLSVPDSILPMHVIAKNDSLYYDLWSLDFDPETRTFGQPKLEVNVSRTHHSLSVPRVSPDGRYVLYTLGRYGQFHIWHMSSDLWVKDLQRDTCYALSAANSIGAPDSYHSWSSNGRWIAFASRRLDKNYSRAFIAYFDREGQAHKAFLLPQEDPEHNTLLLKSYNVPELTRDAVHISPEKLRKCIYETEGEKATYKAPSPALPRGEEVNGISGPSPLALPRAGRKS